jgi:hypothetical protein
MIEVHQDSFMVPVGDDFSGNSVLCICTLCGNKKQADKQGLKKGAIRSCGCLRDYQPRNDFTGQTLPSGITVVGYVHSALWRVKYTCGHSADVALTQAKVCKTGLCSKCAKTKVCVDRSSHGSTRTPTYQSWRSMKARCYDKNSNRFQFYGARGIKVCDRWLNSFENFYSDMGERPDGMSLDRVDTDGNYEPSNCKWSTEIEQANNKTTNLLFTDGEQVWSLMRWCDIFGKDYKHIWYKYRTCRIPIELLFDGKLK